MRHVYKVATQIAAAKATVLKGQEGLTRTPRGTERVARASVGTVKGNGVRVLLVEDDARSARTLAKMLDEDGFSTEIAFDGASAIARLGRGAMPDVLLVDYRLPHIDGLAVAAYARSIKPDLPVIMLTSYSEVVAHARSNLNPAPVILAKPLVYGDLTAELTRVTAS
jgi:CheY-like chemotaxis protein